VENKIMVLARFSIDVLKKLESIERIPHKEKHKRNVPDYYGNFITRYTETIEFQLRQKESEHKKVIAQKDVELRTARADASNAKFQLTFKNVEIEMLKKQVEELKRPAAAAA
jgi:hypothetical protein